MPKGRKSKPKVRKSKDFPSANPDFSVGYRRFQIKIHLPSRPCAQTHIRALFLMSHVKRGISEDEAISSRRDVDFIPTVPTNKKPQAGPLGNKMSVFYKIPGVGICGSAPTAGGERDSERGDTSDLSALAPCPNNLEVVSGRLATSTFQRSRDRQYSRTKIGWACGG